MSTIDKRLFLKLFIAFIAATVIGTISHEFGHYIVARYFGYAAKINYAATLWTPVYPGETVSAKNYFYIAMSGPLQTMLTGSIGVVLLLCFRKRYFSSRELNGRQWGIIFISLFWLRQTANFVTWVGGFLVTGRYSTRGDEVKMADYLQLPPWTITTGTAGLGLIVLTVVVFKFIPPRQRVAFLAAGFTGGIAGYILWIEWLGQYVMP